MLGTSFLPAISLNVEDKPLVVQKSYFICEHHSEYGGFIRMSNSCWLETINQGPSTNKAELMWLAVWLTNSAKMRPILDFKAEVAGKHSRKTEYSGTHRHL